MTETELKLLKSFPGSFINQEGEFVAHDKANEYFILRNCKSDLDIKCKVLEWFSRGAFKTEPYRAYHKNRAFHEFMRNGMNDFLGTYFTETDMEVIYQYLGNCVDHDLTLKFIDSGYDIECLLGRKITGLTEVQK